MIAQDYNTRFRPERVQFLIFFDGEDAHSWNRARGAFGTKDVVFRRTDLEVSVLGFYPGLLFAEASCPRVSIGVCRVKCCKEGAWALTA